MKEPIPIPRSMRKEVRVIRARMERDAAFVKLRRRLSKIHALYNSPDANLHFAPLKFADADLYPSLVSLAEDGLAAVRPYRAFLSKSPLYDDGMFWYKLFLTISSAAARVSADGAFAYIPSALVDRLLRILIAMSSYTVSGGDISKRNAEALGNTLLTFYSQKRLRALRQRAAKSTRPVKEFLVSVDKRVADRRSEEKLP